MDHTIKKLFKAPYYLLRRIFLCASFGYDYIRLAKKSRSLEQKHGLIWLFSERVDEACDNGYRMYCFVREHYPEIPAFYVISSPEIVSSTNRAIKSNLITHGSDAHKIHFFAARLLLSSHGRGYIEPWTHKILKVCYPGYRNKKFVFLQHGVIYSDLTKKLHKDVAPVDLFITGAKPEYDYLLDTLGYTKDELKYTGLARYDLLHELPKSDERKCILLMPTWRMYLEKISQKDFLLSDYFKHYDTLLRSSRLVDILEQYNVDLIFYPHYEMQKFLVNFASTSSRVIIAPKDRYSVPDLLRGMDMLITDSSSVFFDCAYMQKALVYDHFDREAFYENHYKRGYFDFGVDGFGPVATDVEGIIDHIEENVLNDFANQDVYTERSQKFFPLYDTNNSQRIFDEIIKMIK